jgi:hypothetical protein
MGRRFLSAAQAFCTNDAGKGECCSTHAPTNYPVHKSTRKQQGARGNKPLYTAKCLQHAAANRGVFRADGFVEFCKPLTYATTSIEDSTGHLPRRRRGHTSARQKSLAGSECMWKGQGGGGQGERRAAIETRGGLTQTSEGIRVYIGSAKLDALGKHLIGPPPPRIMHQVDVGGIHGHPRAVAKGACNNNNTGEGKAGRGRG